MSYSLSGVDDDFCGPGQNYHLFPDGSGQCFVRPPKCPASGQIHVMRSDRSGYDCECPPGLQLDSGTMSSCVKGNTSESPILSITATQTLGVVAVGAAIWLAISRGRTAY